MTPSVALFEMLVDCAIFLAPCMFFGTIVQRRLSFTDVLFSTPWTTVFVYDGRIAHEGDSVFVGREEVQLC